MFTRLLKIPKTSFFFFDAGVARATADLLDEVPDRDWLGYSFETLILNELRMRNQVSHQDRRIMYYKVHSGREVDFVIEIKKGTLRSIPKGYFPRG